ncbi:MAG: beta-glucosidase, partial [Lachnospiraceae bacterium]|nr:beta-glucosidase [Lachnospiraceae bacterium]
NGNDMMLVAYDTETNHLTDTTSATSVIAMRQAAKNAMYTVVNSRAYAEENLNPAMPTWKIALIVVDVLLAALLICMLVTGCKKYRKLKTEEPVEETAES